MMPDADRAELTAIAFLACDIERDDYPVQLDAAAAIVYDLDDPVTAAVEALVYFGGLARTLIEGIIDAGLTSADSVDEWVAGLGLAAAAGDDC